MHTAQLLCPRSQKRQGEFKSISPPPIGLQQLDEVAVLLMVKPFDQETWCEVSGSSGD